VKERSRGSDRRIRGMDLKKRRQGKEEDKENWIERTSCDLRIRRTGLK
jgi:hypothetical protein